MPRRHQLLGARHAIILLALIHGLAAGALVAPAAAASASVSAAENGCPRGAANEITNAFTTLFSRNQPATIEQRVAVLAGGERVGLRAVLDAWLADPSESQSSVNVTGIRCQTPTRAVLDADLLLATTELTEVLPPGRAVRQDGVWKVARSTFCARVTTSDPRFAAEGACAR